MACIYEATAPKPGNVYRGADFEDMTYVDLVTAAVAIAPAMDAAATGQSLGRSVLDSIDATRRLVGVNCNLGTVLLLAPMAKVPLDVPLSDGIAAVLRECTPADAADVYEAIRRAQPGGLGRAETADVAGPPPDDLIAAMRLAADRDLVARQYADDFTEVLGLVVPSLANGVQQRWSLADTIVHTQMQLMSRLPDSLIARKCGAETAAESSARAAAVLAAGPVGSEAYQRALADLDFWLRCDGHRRNPGTTADLIAAGLFATLRDGIIKAPWRFYG